MSKAIFFSRVERNLTFEPLALLEDSEGREKLQIEELEAFTNFWAVLTKASCVPAEYRKNSIPMSHDVEQVRVLAIGKDSLEIVLDTTIFLTLD